jgi:hypothetical protein
MWKTILDGWPSQAILTNRKKHRQLFELYHTITPREDENGEFTHFVATSKNLTPKPMKLRQE